MSNNNWGHCKKSCDGVDFLHMAKENDDKPDFPSKAYFLIEDGNLLQYLKANFVDAFETIARVVKNSRRKPIIPKPIDSNEGDRRDIFPQT